MIKIFLGYFRNLKLCNQSLISQVNFFNWTVFLISLVLFCFVFWCLNTLIKFSVTVMIITFWYISLFDVLNRTFENCRFLIWEKHFIRLINTESYRNLGKIINAFPCVFRSIIKLPSKSVVQFVFASEHTREIYPKFPSLLYDY